MAGNIVLAGYMTPMGAKLEVIADHPGPASYVNSGTFATSGEIINASDFGLGGFEDIHDSDLTAGGLHFVKIQLVNSGNGNAVPTARLHWFLQSSGAEIANGVNLSTAIIRLKIRGV